MQLSDFDDRNRALGDRLLLHIRHVRVNVCGRGDIRMTEPFLNLLEGKALLEQERRDRMPQIVKPDARQTGAAADAPELAGNIVRAERRAVLTDADIIALVVGFAVFPAVFLLAAAKIGQIPPQRVRQRQRAVARSGS